MLPATVPAGSPDLLRGGNGAMTDDQRTLTHGGDLHRAGIWAVREHLERNGWTLGDPDQFSGMAKERRPDVVATGWEERTAANGKKSKRRIKIAVECETANRAGEMAERNRFYTETFPPKADRFIVVPLWKLKDQDPPLSKLRAFVGGYLP